MTTIRNIIEADYLDEAKKNSALECPERRTKEMFSKGYLKERVYTHTHTVLV